MLLPVGSRSAGTPGAGGAGALVGAALVAILLGSVRLRRHRPPHGRHARAEVNLAAANGLYLVLLLLGGMIVPLAKLPALAWPTFAKLLPAAALSAAPARHARRGTPVTLGDWVVLAVWAVAAPLAAGAHVPLGMTAPRAAARLRRRLRPGCRAGATSRGARRR